MHNVHCQNDDNNGYMVLFFYRIWFEILLQFIYQLDWNLIFCFSKTHEVNVATKLSNIMYLNPFQSNQIPHYVASQIYNVGDRAIWVI